MLNTFKVAVRVGPISSLIGQSLRRLRQHGVRSSVLSFVNMGGKSHPTQHFVTSLLKGNDVSVGKKKQEN